MDLHFFETQGSTQAGSVSASQLGISIRLGIENRKISVRSSFGIFEYEVLSAQLLAGVSAGKPDAIATISLAEDSIFNISSQYLANNLRDQ